MKDGNGNSGDMNSGDCNSGHWNSGNRNSGNWNSGNRNSGDRNSGNWNSGDRNSGDGNSGDGNSGDRNSGYFNTNEPTLRMFNKDTNLYRKDVSLPYIDLELNKWVDIKDIPKNEQTGEMKICEGVLTTFTYKEAWGNYWNKIDEATKEQFKALPNFDAEIFKEITGIDVEDKVKIEVEGKIVYISRESAIALNLIKG